MAVIADIETDGLLPELTKIHCIATRGPDGVKSWGPEEIPAALDYLASQPEIIGHNWQGFDNLAIQKLYPRWKHTGKVTDTQVLARLLWPDIGAKDHDRQSRGIEIPKELFGRHSLEAWGFRLKVPKSPKVDFSAFTEEMRQYNIQDTAVTEKLYQTLSAHKLAPRAVELEHRFAEILDRQMRHGVVVDRKAADLLIQSLASRRAEVDQALAGCFPPFVEHYETPKRKEKKTRTKLFNPNSRDHIERALRLKYGWKPTVFTPTGKAQIDEGTIGKLPYPETPFLVERLALTRNLGQIVDGDKSILSAMKEDGRVYGYINHNGTVTSRCKHSHPNLGNVPAVERGKDKQILFGAAGGYGWEFRSVFSVPAGYRLVGCDASGLELRCLAHYMARYDGGAYTKVLLEGDVHSVNQAAAGLATRDQAKTFIYAFLYGAGDEKIGSIVGGGEREGRALKKKFLKGLPALKRLKDALLEKLETRNYIYGLDGRIIWVRHPHAILNTLFQGAGAVIMKQATVNLDNAVKSRGLDSHQVLHVHDEYQHEASVKDAEEVGKAARQAIRDVTQQFNFQCPLDGEYKVGNNWAETH